MAVFVGGSSDFFEIPANVVVFGFVTVDVFDVAVVVVDDDDDDDGISDVVVVDVSLNLLLVRFTLPRLDNELVSAF